MSCWIDVGLGQPEHLCAPVAEPLENQGVPIYQTREANAPELKS